MDKCYLGVDIGAENIKAVVIKRCGEQWVVHSTLRRAHDKSPQRVFFEILGEAGANCERVAICGRFARHFKFPVVPVSKAQSTALEYFFPGLDMTLVSVGCRGFSVLEKRGENNLVFRENSRCSQGTGNFLRQLVERFNLTLEEADKLCDATPEASQLSGRCPVILKTDMTHLANKGESSDKIVAGVYDAIVRNVRSLVKSSVCPKKLALSGGIMKSGRIRRAFAAFCAENDLEFVESDEILMYFGEALGCAILAAQGFGAPIDTDPEAMTIPTKAEKFDRIEALKNYRSRVIRMPKTEALMPEAGDKLIFGFDIGSTGSKAVAIRQSDKRCCWEGYLRTNGDPIGASKQLVEQFLASDRASFPIVAIGVTGSGREIVSSLLKSCFGASTVRVLNEIAAHAEGALFIDPEVDTIFEIGGQDAKYIRLQDGKIVDAAMNEACSAGTGSFIEEQGKKFSMVKDVTDLSKIALGAQSGLSLGQHCSVFMSEIIDEAIGAGIEFDAIIAGIFDSVILNYFNRVKGNRSVGQRIFCQGMPFASDAPACAVVRQCGADVVIPPNPGTVGAQGIAILASRQAEKANDGLDLSRYLSSRIVEKTTFVCKSNKGCGGSGNQCRIDKIKVALEGKTHVFTWGGACSLWDKAGNTDKLPDRCPDPFKEREERVLAHIASLKRYEKTKTIGIADEFQLKSLFVFFSAFLNELGFNLNVFKGGTQHYLKKGLEGSNLQFCAPMQHFQGLAAEMVADDTNDFVFFPMMRGARKIQEEEYAVICPIVQSSSDILKSDLHIEDKRFLSPVVDFDTARLDDPKLRTMCQKLALKLGAVFKFETAMQKAVKAQSDFDAQCLASGRRALDFAKEHKRKVVVVLGRNYTIHNSALNSNVPFLLREQGAVAIPVDCFPVPDNIPLLDSVYWMYGQLNLRAATAVRMTENIYALWCSNYSCGPDSFNLHFFNYIMRPKPFAVIETDGHSGDAGTKTRIEAFLHCVSEYEEGLFKTDRPTLHELEKRNKPLNDVIKDGSTLLIPPMGDNKHLLVAGFRALGMKVEALPLPTRSTVIHGRRHTSGKECYPMLITLGTLLERLEKSTEDEELVFFMPRSCGPCRLGCYNLLDKIVVENLGLSKKVHLWSLADTDFSEGVPMYNVLFMYTSFIACDMMQAALYYVRPIEKIEGEANRIYAEVLQKLVSLLENSPSPKMQTLAMITEILSGRYFGIAEILRDYSQRFADIADFDKKVPTVGVTGEIYVRCEPFSNGFVIDELEKRGIRSMFAPFSECLEYVNYVNTKILKTATDLKSKMASGIVNRILDDLYRPTEKALRWPKRHRVPDILKNAAPYLRKELVGEEILTIGTPLTAYKHGQIDAALTLGPFECMPAKIAHSQFFHVAQDKGIPHLDLSFNGDPTPAGVLDDFAFEVRAHFDKRMRSLQCS